MPVDSNLKSDGFDIVAHLAIKANQSRPFLFTDEQDIKILRDQAIFSDSMAARTRAVNELALKYGAKAIAALEEILQTIPSNESTFKAICTTTLVKLRHVETQRLYHPAEAEKK